MLRNEKSKEIFDCFSPDQIMDNNVRNPEMFDDIRSHIDFTPEPSSLKLGGTSEKL